MSAVTLYRLSGLAVLIGVTIEGMPSTARATIQPALTGPGRLTLAGSIAGRRGPVREVCALDLRQFASERG